VSYGPRPVRAESLALRLDEKTGKFWRKTTAEEAVVEPYTVKAPPAWIADRMKAAVK
jgi:hypothetical protein